ncbi:hypothetical protein GGI08_004269 [Coemansia sp. S2]|nr:hypothetical protein GGI08_004269 [Coemansia sp. S2]
MFDAKNASHVYASSGNPEDLFAKYLNKQFLTNESRKRKDDAEKKDDNSGGTYGFDNNGSFIRRRLAVVNEYKVTSDGPSSGNLHVKYTKQYHNPNGTPAKRDASGSQSSVQPLSEPTMTPLQTPTTSFAHSVDGTIADLQRAAINDLVRAPVPVRSISLLKHGSLAYVPSPADVIHHEMSMAGGSGINRSMSAIELGMQSGHMPKSADNLMMTCRDLSTLSLLSHHSNGSNNVNIGVFAPGCVPNMLGLVDPSMQPRSLTSPTIAYGQTSSKSRRPTKAETNIDNGESDEVIEPRAKRPKSQSFAYPDRESELTNGRNPTGLANSAIIPPRKPVDASMADAIASEHVNISQSLVESFLANPGVSELLQSTWQTGSIVSPHPAFLLQSINPSMGSSNFNASTQGVCAMDIEGKQLAGSSDVYTDDYESEHEYDDDHNSDDDDDDGEDGEDGEMEDDDDDDKGEIDDDEGRHIESDDKLSKSHQISNSKYGQSSDSIESVATKVHPSSRNSNHGEYYQQRPTDAQAMALQGLNMAHPAMFEPMTSGATLLGGIQQHSSDSPYTLMYAPSVAVDQSGAIRFLPANPQLFNCNGTNQQPLPQLQSFEAAMANALDYAGNIPAMYLANGSRQIMSPNSLGNNRTLGSQQCGFSGDMPFVAPDGKVF